jgi:hypothetical protein
MSGGRSGGVILRAANENRPWPRSSSTSGFGAGDYTDRLRAIGALTGGLRFQSAPLKSRLCHSLEPGSRVLCEIFAGLSEGKRLFDFIAGDDPALPLRESGRRAGQHLVNVRVPDHVFPEPRKEAVRREPVTASTLAVRTSKLTRRSAAPWDACVESRSDGHISVAPFSGISRPLRRGRPYCPLQLKSPAGRGAPSPRRATFA